MIIIRLPPGVLALRARVHFWVQIGATGTEHWHVVRTYVRNVGVYRGGGTFYVCTFLVLAVHYIIVGRLRLLDLV